MSQVTVGQDTIEPAPQARHAGKAIRIGSWVAQVLISLIYAQSLFFKFLYVPETQVIFESMGGRAGATTVGLMELVAIVLLLVPRTAAVGALWSTLVISGAIMSHLFIIGIQVVNPETGQGDGGTLFLLALLIAALSIAVLTLRRYQLPLVGDRLP